MTLRSMFLCSEVWFSRFHGSRFGRDAGETEGGVVREQLYTPLLLWPLPSPQNICQSSL